MRIQEIVRDSSGEGDGQFAPADKAGQDGYEVEHRIVLTAQERNLLDVVGQMMGSDNQTALDAYLAGAIIALMHLRGERLREITDVHFHKGDKP